MTTLAATSLTRRDELRISLGNGAACVPGLAVLAGSEVEELFGPAVPAGRCGPLSLHRAGDWLLGAATVPARTGLEESAGRIYDAIFQATEGCHLARIWNYVPAINETGPGGLENYRLFCRGRSLAFERRFGAAFNAALPAASAVGGGPGALTVIFAASRLAPHHVENPLQVAAYHYPVEFGPRPPSFARATIVPGPRGAAVFISGTAAIRGHATVAPRSLGRQLDCTLVNLGGIARACGLGPNLDQHGGSTRHFKVYVRHAADQPRVATLLAERLLVDADRVTYLRADLCRAPLCIEIEASLFGVKLGRPRRTLAHAPLRA